LAKRIKDPGLGKTSSPVAKRMVNKDGTFNVVHLNKAARLREAYNYLVQVSWGRLFLWVILAYTVLNVLFAVIYYAIGVEQITATTGNAFHDFMNAFFFSCQTMTTLGYGAMSPTGIASGIVSSIEALLGLLMFSFITGLLYGRFSKPKASIRFSEHVVYRDFKLTQAIMFRLVNNRKSIMINPKVSMTLSLSEKNNQGSYSNSFYALKLERSQISYLPTTWTVVHEIDDQSPLYRFDKASIKKQTGELLIMISYYDDSFNQEVHQLHSYMLSELKMNYKFSKAFYYNEAGKMVLDHKLLDAIEPLKS
jgi:inward rectifier potassium channel